MQNFKITFIGLGTQRSATSWTHACLAEHPDICMPKDKETYYLRNLEISLKEYEQHFAHCTESNVLGEFTPNYLYSDHARENIKKWFPDAKFLVSLRNPVDRALSRFHYKKSIRANRYETFEETINKEAVTYLEQGRYAHYLKKYFDIFSREQFLIYLYDDVIDKPHECIRKIFGHIGVDDTFIPPTLNNKINISATNRVKHHLTYHLAARTSFLLRNKLHADKYKFGKPVIKTLDKIRLRSKNHEHKHIPAEKTKLDPTFRSCLMSYYKEDIKELEEIMERKLSWK